MGPFTLQTSFNIIKLQSSALFSPCESESQVRNGCEWAADRTCSPGRVVQTSAGRPPAPPYPVKNKKARIEGDWESFQMNIWGWNESAWKFSRLKINCVRDGSSNSFNKQTFQPPEDPVRDSRVGHMRVRNFHVLLCEIVKVALTSSLRLDGAERGGGKALSAPSRSGCKTWRQRRYFEWGNILLSLGTRQMAQI